MGLVNLEIYPRSTTGKNENRRLRAAGRVPAVLYGKGRETEMIELDAHHFGVVLGHLGGSSAIFSLTRRGHRGSIALLREVQQNPVTDEILHVDLLEIPRGVPVTVDLAVHVIGTCQAVKMGEGSVALNMSSIELSCLPQDLPEYIEMDISELELNDKIFVKDLKAPVGEIVSDPEALVLNIKPAAVFVEEEEEAVEGEEGEGEEGEGETAEGEKASTEDGGKEKSKD